MKYWYIWFVLLFLFLVIYLPQRKRRRVHIAISIIKNRLQRSQANMEELAKRFIGKDCYINLMEGQADGVMTEVENGAIVLEKDGKIQVVNLDYVVKIREYPYKKGKRASIVSD